MKDDRREDRARYNSPATIPSHPTPRGSAAVPSPSLQRRSTSSSTEKSNHSKKRERSPVVEKESKRQKQTQQTITTATSTESPAAASSPASSSAPLQQTDTPKALKISAPSPTISQPTTEPPEVPKVAATAPDSDTPGQLRMFAKMFRKLAFAYKRRGDSASSDIEKVVDHLHAMCNYVLSFFYADRLANTFNKENWDSFHPFADSVIHKLKNLTEHKELYTIALRLSSLVHFHQFNCLQAFAKQQLEKLMANPEESEDVTKRRLKALSTAFKEYEYARSLFRESEPCLSLDQVQQRFPHTYSQVCVQGNLDAGAVLGGEAGPATVPMFPLTWYSSLRHTAMMAKAAINEYITKKQIPFREIRDLNEFYFNK